MPDRPRGGLLRDGVLLAVGTLTALRVPPPARVDSSSGAVAMVLAPVAGLVPGGAATLVALAADAAGAPSLLAAALALGTVALVTRGLHLDGLADTADGLTAAYDRERALAVMRRGDTGPAGAAALVLVLLVQAAALAGALERHGAVAAAAGVVAGRAALTLACTRGVPAARPEGLGATIASSVPPAATTMVVVVVAGAAALVLPGARWTGALAVLASVAVAGALVGRARRRLGGITGDVLGACVEAGTAAALVVLSLHAI